jgi:hypothetical protein
MTLAAWDAILDDNEKIIWQGRPSGKIRFQPKNMFTLLFGLAFAGFALFWMIMASLAGGFFWMFGLIHFSAGIGIIVGPIFWPAFSARRTWYTLTDHRAFIASTTLLGQKKLKSYPITPDTPITLTTNNDETGSVDFAQETRRGNKGRRYNVDIGFHNIPDATDVQRLIRDIQKVAT